MSIYSKSLDDVSLLQEKSNMYGKVFTFKCNPLAPKAMLALQMHMDANPSGMNLYCSKSKASKLYFGMYKIRETKTSVIVEMIG